MNKNVRIFIDAQIIIILLIVGLIGSPFINEPIIDPVVSGTCGGAGILYFLWRFLSF